MQHFDLDWKWWPQWITKHFTNSDVISAYAATTAAHRILFSTPSPSLFLSIFFHLPFKFNWVCCWVFVPALILRWHWPVLPLKVCLFELYLATVVRATKIHIIRTIAWVEGKSTKSAFQIFIFNWIHHSYLARSHRLCQILWVYSVFGGHTMRPFPSVCWLWTSELSLSGRWQCHTLHLIIQV